MVTMSHLHCDFELRCVLQAPRHTDQGKVVLHATASPFSEVSLESLQSMCSNNSEAVSTCSLTGEGEACGRTGHEIAIS